MFKQFNKFNNKIYCWWQTNDDNNNNKFHNHVHNCMPHSWTIICQCYNYLSSNKGNIYHWFLFWLWITLHVILYKLVYNISCLTNFIHGVCCNTSLSNNKTCLIKKSWIFQIQQKQQCVHFPKNKQQPVPWWL
jgi:hypothetical protein